MKGPLLVALGALLWATDAPFRISLFLIPPTLVVGLEHLVGFSALGLAALIAPGVRRGLFSLRVSEWGAMVLVGAGASAGATILFTLSFRYINPSLTILLQKLQPFLVIVLARLILAERARKGYWLWGGIAIVAGFILSFPSPNIDFGTASVQSKGVLCAIAAAALWAAATVVGRHSLSRLQPNTVTFWRYAFGLIGTLAILALQNEHLPVGATFAKPEVAGSILYMGLVSGLGSMLLYYRGLQRTEASVATLMELVYPLSAVLINATILGATLKPIQLGAGALLIFAAYQVSRR